MDISQYTPDAICRAMGLPAFVEPDWSPPTLRLLLMPSFHPEVCITLTGPADVSRLSVVALSEQFWAQETPRALTAWSDEAPVPSQVFSDSLAAFDRALAAERQSQEELGFLDGMPITSCLLSRAGFDEFACHPYLPEVTAFVGLLLRMAWEASTTPMVRIALAECGSYVRLGIPHEPLPTTPSVTHLAVLGTPEARAELLAALQPDSDKAAKLRDQPDLM